MKSSRFASSFGIFLLVLLAETNLYSQWKNIAPGLLNSGCDKGIIAHYGNTLWACHNQAWFSDDSGKVWSLRSPYSLADAGTILDISFYSANTIALTGLHGPSQIYITHDQGLSWIDITPQGGSESFTSLCFAGSSQDIIAASNYGNMVVTHDGGKNWQSGPFDGCVFSVRAGTGRTAYAIAGMMSGSGKLYETLDAGDNWRMTTGQYDWDCFSFERDLCDTATFYIANEDVIAPIDQLSCIYVSHDKGASWKMNNPHSIPYYCGSIAVTPSVIFAQTYTSVERSTDMGNSWGNIGGPPNKDDTRFVTALDGNIIFAVDIDGNIWATFNSGGDSLSLPKNGSLAVSPKSIFNTDTVNCNDSVRRSFHFTQLGCNPPTISGWKVIGIDSLSYGMLDLTTDSGYIAFRPNTTGDHSASLLITLSDGSVDTISLKGYNKGKPFSFTASPLRLFGNDSMYICDRPVVEKFIVTTDGCLPKIITQNISGPDKQDYQVIRQITDPLIPTDSVIISFDPSDSGARNALYELTFDDGTSISVSLGGFGIPSRPLSLAALDQSTDTIGGSAFVPIVINGLEHAEDIELILHYDKELTYHGSYSLANVPLDLPSEGWNGRSKLQIPQAVPNTILAYAQFDVFNDSLRNSYVTFDSVTILTAIPPCKYILPASVISTITPPSGCGIRTISRFMHSGGLPQLSIAPNPTSGEVSLFSTEDLGDVSIAVYDMLGVQRGTDQLTIGKNTPVKFALPEANGIYTLRVKQAGRTYDLRVAVNR